MFPIAIQTFRVALRSAGPWLATTVGVFLVWAGSSLNVLALSSGDARSTSLALTTLEMTCCVLALWLMARRPGMNFEENGLEAELKAALAGRSGVMMGTWAGAIVGALIPLVPGALALVLYIHNGSGQPISL